MTTEMQIRPFPDKNYACDGLAQTMVSENVAIRDRLAQLGLIVIIVLVLLSLLFVILRIHVLFWIGMAISLLLFVVIFVSCIWSPKVMCSSCGTRMISRWISGDEAEADLYFVCENCKRYAYAHE